MCVFQLYQPVGLYWFPLTKVATADTHMPVLGLNLWLTDITYTFATLLTCLTEAKHSRPHLNPSSDLCFSAAEH